MVRSSVSKLKNKAQLMVSNLPIMVKMFSEKFFLNYYQIESSFSAVQLSSRKTARLYF